MLVTQVLPVDKKRSQVWLDEEFAFVLYKGELRRYKVETGNDISEKDYNEIMQQILPKRAKLRAMNLLKSHTYSVNGLRDKLKEGYYPDSVINIALDYVASYGYTDDLRMAEEYIRIHMHDKSSRRIAQDLYRKGISKDVVTRAFEECAEDDFVPDEQEQIRQLLKKRKYSFDDSGDIKEYMKHYNFLLRKGYKASLIRQVMGKNDIYENEYVL